MPVDSKNEQYTKFSPVWKKMRDVVDGQDAIHKGAEKYLPKLEAQSQSDYESYKTRAPFYNTTGRTVDGLTGMVFMKDPAIVVPERMEEYLKDIDMNGLPFNSLAEQVMDELCIVTRCGLLVDHTEAPMDIDGSPVELTVSDAKTLGMRPYISMYKAEHITNWRVGRVGNAIILTMVVLFEQVDEQGDDEFTWDKVDQYRVLDISPEGFYRQRIFRNDGQSWQQYGDDVYPLKGGQRMMRIPFTFLGAKDLGASVDKPIMKDLAEMNLAHYRNTASHEHGLYWIGLPTPVVTGSAGNTDADGNIVPFTLGPTEFLTLSNENAQAFFMELEGKGLDHLQQEIAKKEERMAALGARMLQPEKLAPETEGALSIKRQGEIGVLASLASVASLGLTKALKTMAEWDQIDPSSIDDISVKLNSDYVSSALTPQQQIALMQQWQAGAIGYSDYVYAMQKGEILRPERTSDDMRAEIEEEGPALGEI